MSQIESQPVLLIGGCGHIGSYLYLRLKSAGARVTVCDMGVRGNPLETNLVARSYQSLTKEFLQRFKAILWFAGHSSVGSSVIDPQGALSNNCLDLYDFAKKIPADCKFIYASTASLYSTEEAIPEFSDENSLLKIPAQNPYDSSKFAFDYIAGNFLQNFYGLRMGTVSGWSPNLRTELMFNAMSIAASRDKIVNLSNGTSWRTILFLEDLWILIHSLLARQIEPGFINAGSVTLTIREFASRIAAAWGASIVDHGRSPTYSFALDCSKMQKICGNILSNRSILDETKSFIAAIENQSAQ